MLDIRTLHKEFGLLESQVSQVCKIVDKKVFMINEEMAVLKNMIQILQEQVIAIQKVVADKTDVEVSDAR
jgi:hypothetical protein